MHRTRSLGLVALTALGVACGSQTSSSSSVTTGPSESQLRAERERKAREEHAANVANHRKLEHQQQDALGATCDDLGRWAKQQCTPSCYPVESKDARAGTKLAGAVEIQHVACQRAGAAGAWLVMDEIEPAKLTARAFKKRAPKPHKAGTWQAEVAASIVAQRAGLGKPPHGDVIAVLGGAARSAKHPVTGEALQCVTVAHYTTARGTVDACGGTGKTTCEAAGNAAARGVNLARYRIVEAERLREAGKVEDCQRAALDAVAIARGLPRWRQYAKLNVGAWTEGLAYRTRADGVLDEDALFALAPGMEREAQQIFVACAGASPKSTPEQEHAFHSCPAR